MLACRATDTTLIECQVSIIMFFMSLYRDEIWWHTNLNSYSLQLFVRKCVKVQRIHSNLRKLLMHEYIIIASFHFWTRKNDVKCFNSLLACSSLLTISSVVFNGLSFLGEARGNPSVENPNWFLKCSFGLTAVESVVTGKGTIDASR